MECVHLEDNVKVLCDHLNENLKTSKHYECSECGIKEQNWLCLHCGVINCGRYMKAHAKEHAEKKHHEICISCDVFSVYCYKCDDYVSNDTSNQLIDKIRQFLVENGEQNVNEQRESTEQLDEISKDGSEGSSNTSSVQNTEQQIYLGTDNITNDQSTQYVPDTNKTDITQDKTKLKNPDEPVRNLRPRSRKRSLSEDSSSTENTQSAPRSKEKKYNGKSQREKKVVGLKNLGNTCFMNAVLQSLSNIQEFSCYFNTLPSLEMKTNGRKVYHSRSYTRQEMHDVVMAEELRKVLINLNTGGCGSKGAISPECLFLVIWKVVPRFRGYQQQDAHEFLRYMLDRLHTELLQLLPAESREMGVMTSPRSGSASIVTAVFGGTLQSEVRCLACGTESKKFDPFLDLSLELPESNRHDAPVPLMECLKSFVQVEELADSERYYCSSCKCKQRSTKQFWIRRLPNVLCLHLKRFRWSNYFRTKVDSCVSFPLSALDMSPCVLDPPAPRTAPAPTPVSAHNLYDLAAVIVHHGNGASSGHYTAFAINEDQWFHFNDQTVRATDATAVAGCKPYILFYIRRELTLPPHTTAS